MATELGVAYLSLSASTKDFAKDVRNALKDIEAPVEETSKKAGSKLGAGLKKGLKIGTAAVAGLVGVVGALALKGGISRALAIEDAQAKLKGLGHDTKSITAIMDSALASVKGTAFGLGDAATVAASTVAAGIKPGEDLTRTLKLVADASTIAGTSMSDMGAIFNKVAGTGKIQGEVIAQLGERGIPILQLLADELGVTAGEVAKMASSGKIDFETFQNAMEAGMGGAALKSGETFRGAMANAGAALGRLGERVVAGVLPQIKDGFTGAIAVMDSWAPAAEVVGERIGAALRAVAAFVKDEVIPVLKDVADWFGRDGIPRIKEFAGFLTDDVVPALREVTDWIKSNRAWLEPLTVALVAAAGAWKLVTTAISAWKGLTAIIGGAKAAVIALNVALRANPIGLVITAITALVAGLVWFFTQTEVGRQIWETVWGAIQTAVQAVVDWWQNTALPALTAVWTAISEAASAFAAWFMEHVAPVFQAFGDYLQALFDRVATIFRFMWENIWQPILGALVDLWNWVWGTLSALWEKIGPPIFDAISRHTQIVKTVWTTVWNVIKAVFEGVWNAIRTVVETVLAVIKGVIKTATAVIKGDWEGAWNAIKSVFSSIWEGMERTVRNTIDTIGNVIGTIKDTVLGVFSTVGTWLYEAGRDLMQGLVNGIKNMALAPANAAKEVGTRLVDGVKGVLGISSPSRVFRQIGEFTVQGLTLGLESGAGDVRQTMRGLIPDLPDRLTVTATGRREPFTDASAAPARTGDTYVFGNLTLSEAEAPPEVREFFRNLRRNARMAVGV